MAGDSVDGRKNRTRRGKKESEAQLAAVPDTFNPALEAHRLRIEGKTWREAAEAVGYKDEIVAQLAVTAYLQKAAIAASEEQAKAALDLEEARLDEMVKAWWTPGTSRLDDKAANVLLRISAQRLRIWEMRYAADRGASTAARTIVITGSSEDYISGLRRIVEGDGQAPAIEAGDGDPARGADE